MNNYAKKTVTALQEKGMIQSSENERLHRDIHRSDMEKLRLFTKMLRTNRMLNKAIITHK